MYRARSVRILLTLEETATSTFQWFLNVANINFKLDKGEHNTNIPQINCKSAECISLTIKETEVNRPYKGFVNFFHIVMKIVETNKKNPCGFNTYGQNLRAFVVEHDTNIPQINCKSAECTSLTIKETELTDPINAS